VTAAKNGPICTWGWAICTGSGRLGKAASPTVDSVSPTEPKSCVVCGRTITWRKKWERTWAEVKYCSAACRRQKLRPVDHQLTDAIETLLDERKLGSTICPSEAARLVGERNGFGGEEWRTLMEPARQAARRLVADGRVDITQKGQVVDPSTAKGPIRIRRR